MDAKPLLHVRSNLPTWGKSGWRFIESRIQRQEDGRFLCVDIWGKSYDPPRYEKPHGVQEYDRRTVTYYLPADMLKRDAAAPGASLYGSHTHWLAIREIHLSGLDPNAFEGRDLPTISEEDALR